MLSRAGVEVVPFAGNRRGTSKSVRVPRGSPRAHLTRFLEDTVEQVNQHPFVQGPHVEWRVEDRVERGQRDDATLAHPLDRRPSVRTSAWS